MSSSSAGRRSDKPSSNEDSSSSHDGKSATSPRKKEVESPRDSAKSTSESRTRLGSMKDKDSPSKTEKQEKEKEKSSSSRSSSSSKDKESRSKHALSRTQQRQNSIMPVPMPSPDKVEEMFTKLLADLPPMPSAQKAELMKLNPANKWSFIQANNPETVAKLKDDKGDVQDSPAYFVKKLSTHPSSDLVKDLRVQISTQPAAWQKKFRDSKGMEALLDLLVTVDRKHRNKPEGFRLQNEVLRTIKACFHSKVNIEDFASDVSRLKKLILSLDAGDETVRSLTYELLGLIVLVTQEGAAFVLPAFDFLRYTRSEKHRFKPLVDALTLENTAELVANALILVNAIVNTPESLDERIALRFEMLALGLEKPIGDLKIKFKQSTAHPGQSPMAIKDILEQVEQFEGDIDHDQEEYADRIQIASKRKVNFKDPKELFMALMAHIKDKNHLYGGFLGIMKHLLDLPTDSNRGSKIWWSVARVVQEVSTVTRDTLNDPTAPNSLPSLMGDRLIDVDEFLASSSDKLELERVKEDSFVKIETLEAEMATLKQQLKTALDKALSSSSDANKLLEVAKVKAERALEDTKRELESTKQTRENEKKDFEAQKSTLMLQLSELREKNMAMTQQFSDIKDRLKDTRRTLERTNSFNISADKEDLVRNVEEMRRDNHALHHQVETLKKEIAQMKGHEEEADLMAEMEKLKKKLQDTEHRLLESSAANEIEKTRIESLQKDLDAAKAEAAAMKDLVSTAQANIVVTSNSNSNSSTNNSTSSQLASDPSSKSTDQSSQATNNTATSNAIPAGPPPPGPPPPPGVGPPPPPPGGMGGPPGPPPPGGMKKAPIGPKPKVPMRNFQWSKLAATQATKSIFKDMDFSKVELDLTSLEAQFGAKVVEPKDASSASGKSQDAQPKKEQLISFLDAKRLNNIGIFVQTFKHTYRELAESVLMVNENVITSELAGKLIDNAPLPEELTQITDFVNNGGGVDKLRNVDKFFYQLSFVPQYTARLMCIAFKLNFESKCTELKVSALRVKKANKEFQTAQPIFKKLMEIILAIGNFMNNGTSKGSASGFQLASLNQLVTTKSTDNKQTLLDYLVSFLSGSTSPSGKPSNGNDEILKLPESLGGLQLATKVNWAVLQGDLQDLRKGLSDCTLLANSINKTDNKLDVFAESIPPALVAFDTTLSQVELQFKEIDENYNSLATLYGIATSTIPPEEFYGILTNFLASFDKSIKQVSVNKEKADKEARRIKLEEAKKAADAKRAALNAKKGTATSGTSTPSTASPAKDTPPGSPSSASASHVDDEDLESIVSSARSGESRFRKTSLRRQETLRAQRAQELSGKK